MQISRRTEWLLFAAVLIVAAVLRLGWPGLTEFKADEARLIKLAYAMAEGEAFPLRGISSSVGVPNFPVNIWLYALPLIFSKHLYAPTLFTGLLNTAAVALTYWFTRRYWGWQAALAAALMFAVSPWAVVHSRKIWAQNLLPIFVLGWGISGALALLEGRQRWLALHILCAALAFQIHLAAVSLFVGSAALLLLFWRRLSWRWLLAGVGLALLSAAPFLVYLSQNWGEVRATLGGLGGGEGAAARGGFSLNALSHTLRLNTGWQIHALAGPSAFQDYLNSVPAIWWVHWLWGLLMLGGLGLLIAYSTQRAALKSEAAILVLVWAFAPILTFLWFPTPVELHYLIPTYPAFFIAAGIAFAWLLRWASWRGWLVLAFTAVAQVWIWLVLLTFLAQRSTPGGFGTPLGIQLEAAAAARQLMAKHSAAEFLIAGAGEEPLVDEFAAIYDVLLRDMPHRFVNVEQSAVFPAAPAVILLHPAPSPLAALYEAAATEQTPIPLRTGEGALRLAAVPASAAPTPVYPLAPPPLLANFVSLRGHDGLSTNGEWRLHWQVGQPQPTDFHIFNHLYAADGGRIAQADAAAFGANQWREGDVVISRFVLAGSGERPFTMRVGMYIYPSLTNVPLLDEAANPFADAAEIPLP